jgi:hypothetical protein
VPLRGPSPLLLARCKSPGQVCGLLASPHPDQGLIPPPYQKKEVTAVVSPRSVLCFRAVVARTNWRGMQGEISSLFAGDP